VEPSISEARAALQKLVEKYKKFQDDKSFLNNEQQICDALIKPLLRDVLHWESEDPSEVRPQDTRAGKRPDYVIYNNGISQFIVEAKAATKDLFEDWDIYEQALSYGYNADKEFTILTNFRQVVILASKISFRNPAETAIAKINLLDATDADLEKLLAFKKEYWITMGKDNILYKLLLRHKKAVPVDARLLEDMKHWRSMLLTSIRRSNLKLDFEDEQSFLEIEKQVQKFIDRLVFICYCEDKEIHHEPTLKQLLNEKQERYAMRPGWLLAAIGSLITKYREVPDSDLFDKDDCDDYEIEDNKLLDLLRDLREPAGRPPYNFDYIDADILGRAYENFIGHIQTGTKRFKEKADIGKRKKEFSTRRRSSLTML